jgi:RNA polymerase sigma-70 factor (ECF subfamily)
MTVLGDRGESWFAALYAAHRRDVVRYYVRRLGDAAIAEELAQEVFVIAWRRRSQVPEPGLPWLYGVARRVLANDRRQRRAMPDAVALDHPDQLAATVETVDGALDLRAALATLSEADQEILRLVGWEQLTVAEAAVVLDCARTAARVRLHRARLRLRAALADVEPAPNHIGTPAEELMK